MRLGAATLTVDPDSPTATLPSWGSGFATEQWGSGMPGEPGERFVLNFELVPSWTPTQEQLAHLGKSAVSLLDLLSAHDDAELGLILSSHSNLQHTAATEPRPRHLPVAVADAQCVDRGWGHLKCLLSLRAGASYSQ